MRRATGWRARRPGDAPLCLENFDADANDCSLVLCQDGAQCGTGAHRPIDPQGSACVPDDCRRRDE